MKLRTLNILGFVGILLPVWLLIGAWNEGSKLSGY